MPARSIDRVHFIQKAKSLGFTLNEIAGLLALHEKGKEESLPVREKIQKKLDVVRGKINNLKTLEKALTSLQASCDGKLPVSQCPIIQNIYGK